MREGADAETIYHWWYDGSWHSELVPTGSSFAVGQVSLASSGPGRLDIYFRGHDAVLYHVSSSGSAPYTAAESTGKIIKNYPTASSSGSTLWVFVTGTDNLLYQGEKIGSGSWAWTNISSRSGAGSTLVQGSPAVIPGTREVYVRLAATQSLARYSSPVAVTNWHFANQGQGPFLSAPTTTGTDAYIVDAKRGTWTTGSSAAGWRAFNGYIER